ncbi:MAG: hypothetical protein ABI315_05040 [Bacteroidia bacterium]
MKTLNFYHLYKLNAMRLLTVLFSLLYLTSFSQTIAIAKLDSNSIKIGQQVKLELSVQYRVDNGNAIKIIWPQINDTLRKEIEVVSQSKIDTLIPDKSDPYFFIQKKTLYVTSFDSGYWAMPPFKFIINGDSTGILTDPLLLQVETVSVDTTKAIKDIKEPFHQNYLWIDWLKDNVINVFATLAGILLIAFLIYYFIKKAKNKPPVVIAEKPKVPAHIIAFEKLERLKHNKLWQEGKLKLYYISLTDIVREYIESRYKINTLEQTTEEILFAFRNVAIDEESKSKLKEILVLGDLVKFAKEQPLAAENERSITNAFEFVEGTKREAEPSSTNKNINL